MSRALEIEFYKKINIKGLKYSICNTCWGDFRGMCDNCDYGNTITDSQYLEIVCCLNCYYHNKGLTFSLESDIIKQLKDEILYTVLGISDKDLEYSGLKDSLKMLFEK